MINILLCGANGKMGRVIENCISSREDMQVVAGVDINDKVYAGFPIYSSVMDCREKVDVIIDFSHPTLLSPLMNYATTNQVPIVLATTGYSDDQIKFIKESAKNVAIFFTFNMSLGVNLLLDLAKKATAVLGNQFDIEIIEKHHNQKIDAPSGTAIMIANAINEAAGERYQYEYDRHSKRQKRPKNEIGMHAIRGGTIVGEHEVIFAGRDEVLTLTHSATSKEVFAVGAVNAAAFLNGKPAGIYDMKDLLN
ncbi:MAG: 4-hydroxy-tetrahydrodipicolinate reductase [Oscillospiraceae bacterium]